MRVLRRVLGGFILLIAAWSGSVYYNLHKPCRETDLERFVTANRVEVRDNRGRTLRATDDTVTVRALAAFAFGHGPPWRASWLGKPVGRLSVEFYRGHDMIGHFSIGREFLATFGCDEFRTRAITAEERAMLLKRLDVRDAEA